VGERGKKIARVRLKGQHTTGHAALLGFTFQERQHGLVAAVHAIKVANRQRACACHIRVFEAAKNLHSML
jgi:hypothetical protein